MKSVNLIKITLLALLLLGVGVASTQAQTLSDYSTLPPFLAGAQPPNILLLMDNSGSMKDSAYHDKGESYDPTKTYGGYFDNTKCYAFSGSGSTGKFSVEAGTPPKVATDPPCPNWDGSFLNFISMTKLEVTKFVMMGGKCSARNASGNCLGTGNLIGETMEGVNSISYTAALVSPFTGTCNWNRSTSGTPSVSYITVTNSNSGGTACGTGSSYSTTKSFALTVVPTTEPTGVIQQVGTKARFGLMEYNTTDGGHVVTDVGSTPMVNNGACGTAGLPIINAIECTNPTTWTPLAESLYEASRYFAQIAPAYGSSDYSYTTTSRDPYYFNAPAWGATSQYVRCCKSFVIMFTDGQPTQDLTIPDSLKGYASSFYPVNTNCPSPAGCTTTHTTISHSHSTVANHFDTCSSYYGPESSDPCSSYGSHYLDDIAYWAHTTDLRPDTGNIQPAAFNATPNSNRLTGMQNLNIYTFFAFGTSANILKDAAKVGGFRDLDGDNKPFDDGTCGTATPNPNCQEWDKDGDGVPDTYFESSSAFEMKEQLTALFTGIVQASASGTSVSVLATSSGGEGAIYQAYFYPRVGAGAEEVYWQGYLQGLFFDFKGQLREDTNQDGRLVLSEDKIIETYFDSTLAETMVKRYDVDASGNKTGTPTPVSLKSILPIWEGGRKLADRDLSTNPRVIKTWIDENNDGIVDPAEYINFSTGNEARLRAYLRAADATEGGKIIGYIGGNPVTGYRPRETGSGASKKTWRLGDIIYSSPVSVGTPQEIFDQKYRDVSYTPYFEKYKKRRHVVYVGANDGMLHAFNGGFFHPGDDPSTGTSGGPPVEHGWFTLNPADNSTGKPLGEELWAFIPQELLPHLKWLTETNYDKGKHVYYVDGSPRVTDAQIFPADAACDADLNDPLCVHPKGWGTILIGSMRMGGGEIKVDLNGNGATTDPGEDRFRSAYFALDITNPEAEPKLLWVFKDADLGFTTSWPAIMRFDKDTWHVVFGSGPLTYKGERDKSSAINKFPSAATEYGQIYAVDLKDGALVKKLATDSSDRYAFMGDPIVYDLPKNYASDMVYIGKGYYVPGAPGTWKGKIYRLETDGDKDPNHWKLSVLFDPQKPVFVKPTASFDADGRLWIYFGTGRFLSAGPSSDQLDTSAQAFYGIKESSANGCWDKATRKWKTTCPTILAADLVDVTGASVSITRTVSCPFCGVSTLDDLIKKIKGDSVLPEKAGWISKLTGGERVLHESTVLGGLVAATTYTPGTDVCLPQGTNAVYAFQFETGVASPTADINDADGDGNRDEIVGALGITGTTVNLKKDLGIGVASKVNVVVGRDAVTGQSTLTGFVQSSTGEIVQIKDIRPESKIDSGAKMFREKSD